MGLLGIDHFIQGLSNALSVSNGTFWSDVYILKSFLHNSRLFDNMKTFIFSDVSSMATYHLATTTVLIPSKFLMLLCPSIWIAA